jgi:PKD repeat protein
MDRVRSCVGTVSDRAAAGGALRRALVAALAATAMLGVSASGASAVIVQVEAGKTLSYQPLRGHQVIKTAVRPLDEFFSNLDYNGGPVMPSNTNYTFYWAPKGSPSYPAEYQPGVDQYLEGLAHDSGGHENVDSVSAQYNDAAGAFAKYESHFGGAILDTDPYPANGCTRAAICLTDAQLQAELTSYITAHGLPHDLAHEYFMLTPPGVEDCFQASGHECSAGSSKPVYCAYHGNIPLAGGEIIYSNDPYVTGITGCDDGNHPNGKPSDGALQGGLSHEHNESITDPEPNDAWTDIGGSGGEVGDKCEESMGTALGTAPDGSPYNQVIDGHLYWYQEEWSNQGNGCLQRLTFAGAEPTATFTSAPAGGESVSFDASGSTAPGGVAHYNWQFNDGPGLSIPTETSAPTLSHTFPKAGTYEVALTVFASDGTSIGTAQSITVGSPAAPAVSGLSPKSGPAAGGTSVTVTGTGFTGATAVRFGSASASFTVNSDTSITATSPAGISGTIDVTVATPHGTSATGKSDRFKYGLATVTSVSPATGPKAGGTTVTITGSGFALGSATTFDFGKAPASAVDCSSSTSCTAVTPASTKTGAVDVRASTGAKQSKKNPPGDRFTYT